MIEDLRGEHHGRSEYQSSAVGEANASVFLRVNKALTKNRMVLSIPAGG
jgi:hypothetical protein